MGSVCRAKRVHENNKRHQGQSCLPAKTARSRSDSARGSNLSRDRGITEDQGPHVHPFLCTFPNDCNLPFSLMDSCFFLFFFCLRGLNTAISYSQTLITIVAVLLNVCETNLVFIPAAILLIGCQAQLGCRCVVKLLPVNTTPRAHD